MQSFVVHKNRMALLSSSSVIWASRSHENQNRRFKTRRFDLEDVTITEASLFTGKNTVLYSQQRSCIQISTCGFSVLLEIPSFTNQTLVTSLMFKSGPSLKQKIYSCIVLTCSLLYWLYWFFKYLFWICTSPVLKDHKQTNNQTNKRIVHKKTVNSNHMFGKECEEVWMYLIH